MKICFKCNTSKPLDQFYKHPMMADGHLNKCIQCTKRDSNSHRNRKLQDPQWVIRERQRCRKKMADRRLSGKEKDYGGKYSVAWNHRNKHKRKAQRMAYYAVKKGDIIKPDACNRCGKIGLVEMHHADYTHPLAVEWLCAKCHGETRHIS